jgi:hypothetical protein
MDWSRIKNATPQRRTVRARLPFVNWLFIARGRVRASARLTVSWVIERREKPEARSSCRRIKSARRLRTEARGIRGRGFSGFAAPLG